MSVSGTTYQTEASISLHSEAPALSYLRLPSSCIVYVTMISRDTPEYLAGQLSAHSIGMVILDEQSSSSERTNPVTQELERLIKEIGIKVKQFALLAQDSKWEIENFFSVLGRVDRSQNIQFLGPLEHGAFLAASLWLFETQNQYSSLDNSLEAMERADTKGLPDLEEYQKDRLQQLWDRFHARQLSTVPIATPRPETNWEKIKRIFTCCCCSCCPTFCQPVEKEGYRAI